MRRRRKRQRVYAEDGAVTPVPYRCAGCGEENETLLDPDGGHVQSYTEDCAVCCRPNLLQIDVDPETRQVGIMAVLEYE